MKFRWFIVLLISRLLSQVDYTTQIQPIFDNNCINCHNNGGGYAGGLDLSSYAETLEGGNSGNSLIPSNHSNSILYNRIILPEGNQQFMPQNGTSLTETDISLIAQWIDEGASENPSLTIVRAVAPLTFNLHQNYPNPFNPITTIKYNLTKDSFVDITIYDMLGNVVKNLINKNQNSGYKSVQWNATNNQGKPVSGGAYFYIFQTGIYSQAKKMILLK